jgi:hypothetical protein
MLACKVSGKLTRSLLVSQRASFAMGGYARKVQLVQGRNKARQGTSPARFAWPFILIGEVDS